MNIGKILRYAVIGARFEADRYHDMAMFHEDIDNNKALYYSLMAERTDKDKQELSKIFSHHSKSEIDFR